MGQRKGVSQEAWSALIAEHSAGGGTIAAFCRERGLKVHRFHWHKRRLRGLGLAGGFREVALPVRSAIRVVIPGAGSHIEVERGFDAACLREVVQALQ